MRVVDLVDEEPGEGREVAAQPFGGTAVDGLCRRPDHTRGAWCVGDRGFDAQQYGLVQRGGDPQRLHRVYRRTARRRAGPTPLVGAAAQTGHDVAQHLVGVRLGPFPGERGTTQRALGGSEDLVPRTVQKSRCLASLVGIADHTHRHSPAWLA